MPIQNFTEDRKDREAMPKALRLSRRVKRELRMDRIELARNSRRGDFRLSMEDASPKKDDIVTVVIASWS